MSGHLKVAIAYGVSFRFGLGFEIDKYGFHVNLGPFWLALEWL